VPFYIRAGQVFAGDEHGDRGTAAQNRRPCSKVTILKSDYFSVFKLGPEIVFAVGNDWRSLQAMKKTGTNAWKWKAARHPAPDENGPLTSRLLGDANARRPNTVWPREDSVEEAWRGS